MSKQQKSLYQISSKPNGSIQIISPRANSEKTKLWFENYYTTEPGRFKTQPGNIYLLYCAKGIYQLQSHKEQISLEAGDMTIVYGGKNTKVFISENATRVICFKLKSVIDELRQYEVMEKLLQSRQKKENCFLPAYPADYRQLALINLLGNTRDIFDREADIYARTVKALAEMYLTLINPAFNDLKSTEIETLLLKGLGKTYNNVTSPDLLQLLEKVVTHIPLNEIDLRSACGSGYTLDSYFRHHLGYSAREFVWGLIAKESASKKNKKKLSLNKSGEGNDNAALEREAGIIEDIQEGNLCAFETAINLTIEPLYHYLKTVITSEQECYDSLLCIYLGIWVFRDELKKEESLADTVCMLTVMRFMSLDADDHDQFSLMALHKETTLRSSLLNEYLINHSEDYEEFDKNFPEIEHVFQQAIRSKPLLLAALIHSVRQDQDRLFYLIPTEEQKDFIISRFVFSIVTIYAHTVIYKLEGKESCQEKQHFARKFMKRYPEWRQPDDLPLQE